MPSKYDLEIPSKHILRVKIVGNFAVPVLGHDIYRIPHFPMNIF